MHHLKLFLVLLIFSCFTFPIYTLSAQIETEVTINAEFNNKADTRWVQGESADYDANITDDGYYRIHSKNNDLSQRVDLNAIVFPDEDYEITARIKEVAGGNDDYYGIYIGKKEDTDHYLRVCVSQERDYVITRHNRSDKHIQEWTSTNDVKPSRSWNIFTLTRKNGEITLKLNGVVKKQFTDYYFGEFSEVGFFVAGDLTIEADYLRLKVFNRKINLSKDANLIEKKEALSKTINGDYKESSPILSPDGNSLYLIREGYEIPAIGSGDYDTFWKSVLKDGEWQTPTLVDGKYHFNTKKNRAGLDMTVDGNSFITIGVYEDGEFVNDGFSFVKKGANNSWLPPKEIDIAKITEYDRGSMANISILPDGKTILLDLSRIEDEEYYSEIYVSFKGQDGTWSEPKNLGYTINKGGRAATPEMASDGKTMYFSTSGYPGYGDMDVFMTKRLDDTWTKWSEPVNLGPKVNGPGWEGYFVMPASGEYAYLVSQGDIGNSDIYRVSIAEELKPEPVEHIKGHVYDSKTNNPLDATITLRDLDTDTEIAQAISDPSTGYFEMVLPTGKNYALFAKHDGYYSVREQMNLVELKKYTESSKDLFLSPIEIGQTIKLNNIFFERSQAAILPKSFAELDELVKILTDNPDIRIRIEGHTDNQGPPAPNWKLSQARAEKIKNYLISNSIAAARLEAKGYGPSRPIANNDDLSVRHLNRRVTFVIIK
ncbi:MAG: OmpA family protein [Salibacteraceae bacterium]